MWYTNYIVILNHGTVNMSRTTLVVDINKEFKNKLQQLADADERSLSNFVRRILAHYVEEHYESLNSTPKILRKALQKP